MLAAYGVATLAARYLIGHDPLPAVIARLDARPLTSGAVWGTSLGLLMLALLLAPGTHSQPFLYFQF